MKNKFPRLALFAGVTNVQSEFKFKLLSAGVGFFFKTGFNLVIYNNRMLYIVQYGELVAALRTITGSTCNKEFLCANKNGEK